MTNKKSKSNLKFRINNSKKSKNTNKSRKTKKLKEQSGSGIFDYLYSFVSDYPYQKVEKLVKIIFSNILENRNIECNVRKLGQNPTKTYIIKSDRKPFMLYLTCNIDAGEIMKKKEKEIKLSITDLTGNFVIKTKNEKELIKCSNSICELLHILKEVKVINNSNTDTIELEKFDTFKLSEKSDTKKMKCKNNMNNMNNLKPENDILYVKHYAIVKGIKKK